MWFAAPARQPVKNSAREPAPWDHGSVAGRDAGTKAIGQGRAPSLCSGLVDKLGRRLRAQRAGWRWVGLGRAWSPTCRRTQWGFGFGTARGEGENENESKEYGFPYPDCGA